MKFAGISIQLPNSQDLRKRGVLNFLLGVLDTLLHHPGGATRYDLSSRFIKKKPTNVTIIVRFPFPPKQLLCLFQVTVFLNIDLFFVYNFRNYNFFFNSFHCKYFVFRKLTIHTFYIPIFCKLE